MTIVDYFDPQNVAHLKAWRKLEYGFRADDLEDRHRFSGAMKLLTFYPHLEDSGSVDWPDDWGPLIIAKMADAWLDWRIFAEPRVDIELKHPGVFVCQTCLEPMEAIGAWANSEGVYHDTTECRPG